jgi:hypothetical protein
MAGPWTSVRDRYKSPRGEGVSVRRPASLAELVTAEALCGEEAVPGG